MDVNNELDDRRQRAREAFDDAMTPSPLDVAAHSVAIREGWAERLQRAREEAIETATRVQITPEVIRAAQNGTECDPAECDPCIGAAVRAALRALGLEVVE